MTAQIIDITREHDGALAKACAVLGDGLPVAIPTETVYGLAADATNPAAITRIYETKGRPRFNPLICHMSDLDMAERYAEFDPISRKLAEAFWPGPLTLILPLKPESGIHALATAGLDTVGIRLPKGFASELIRAFGKAARGAERQYVRQGKPNQRCPCRRRSG